MSIYLVGGAVRDALLGRPVKDRDWVVVGQSPEAMLSAGYQQVGADFPVFLHPLTKEEHALARTERKTGVGYHGFVVDASESVTLEEDLARRDLTINAIAQAENGVLIDPFGGQKDIESRVLRHVSAAFAEDPVRVLRVARFAARYAQDGFTVAPETMDLMRQMVAAGEVDHLVPERVWAEFCKAAETNQPSVFLRVLHDCGALARVLPEVDALYGIPQVAEHHPEVDTGIHTEMVLDMAVALAPGRIDVAFAALTHDLGKALSPVDQLPKHLGHEKGGLKPLADVVKRWKVPTDSARLAAQVCEHHLTMHRIFQVRTGTALDLLENLRAFQHPERLTAFAVACEADARGRLNFTDRAYPQSAHLHALLEAGRTVSAEPFVQAGKTGPAIGLAVKRERLRLMHEVHGPMRTPEPPRPPKNAVVTAAEPVAVPKRPRSYL